MYTILAVLITAGCIWLTVLGASCNTVREMKKYLYINLILTGLSVLVGSVIPFLTHARIYGGDYTDEWMSWAWDAFVLFLKTTLPFCFIMLVLICVTVLVTSFTQKQGNPFSAVVRQTAAVAASVILLFLAPFYSMMAETDKVQVHVFILILGVCESLILRFVFSVELAVRIRRTKNAPGKP